MRRGVDHGPQEREAPTLAVHRVLTRRERDVPAVAATLPDAEADQLETGERAVDEVELGIGELSGRVALVVRGDLDGDGVRAVVGLSPCWEP